MASSSISKPLLAICTPHSPRTAYAFELDSKLIFVAKKQTDNLDRLTNQFRGNPAMAAKRTLIVDDEADSASIGYSKKAGLIEANTIALQISELRSAIRQSSFLQVTATPYSLSLQPTEIEVANVMEFKPTRPAFTKLVPVPEDYVGGETYFGGSSKRKPIRLKVLFIILLIITNSIALRSKMAGRLGLMRS
jgi:hypothetical protein